jgi:alkaline phosphatase D
MFYCAELSYDRFSPHSRSQKVTMHTRIAFAACTKFNFDSAQQVWRDIAEHSPDHLMLLGDQIYMDFVGDRDNGPNGFVGYDLGEPARVSDAEFEQQMRIRYTQQASVPSFRALVWGIGQRNGRVEMIWDDHDFGFNNALGLAGGPSDSAFNEYIISPEKRRISRRLFEEFRWNVRRIQDDVNAAYATLPHNMIPGADPFVGVHTHVQLELLDIFLVDTRSFRQSPATRESALDASILGDDQWRWLSNGVRATSKKLVIIASGSPFSSTGFASDQSWRQAGSRKYKPYVEFEALRQLAAEQGNARDPKSVLFIGGDRHSADVVEGAPPLPEFVCAGAAAPKGPFLRSNGRHFCLVDVSDQSRATVRLFRKGEEEDTWPDDAQPIVTGVTTTAATEDRGQLARPLPFSDLYLMTNRQIDGHTPSDEPAAELRYFRFGGERRQSKAGRLKHWDELTSQVFWTAVRTSAARLGELRADDADQICVFVPGNRESNDTAIEQYRSLNDVAFNAQGSGCLGTCILFDWASRMGAFDLTDIYQENIQRASHAAPLLAIALQELHKVCKQIDAHLSLVAHSLGNRVALKALEALPIKTVYRFYANAADLPRDAFATGNGPAALKACQSVLIPYTAKDFVLKYAESADKGTGPRLGRMGPTAPQSIGLHSKDVSDLVSRADPHGGLLWFPWPSDEDAGRLQVAFCRALVQGDWN